VAANNGREKNSLVVPGCIGYCYRNFLFVASQIQGWGPLAIALSGDAPTLDVEQDTDRLEPNFATAHR
jgi:hypothetical protein